MPDGATRAENGYANGSFDDGPPPGRRWLPWLRPFIEEPILFATPSDGKSKEALPVLSIIQCGLCITGLFCQAVAVTKVNHDWLAFAAATATLWTVSALVVALSRPRTGSFTAALVYFCLSAAHASGFIARTADSLDLVAIMNGISSLVAFVALAIVVNMPLRNPLYRADDISKVFTPPTEQLRSPEDNLTLWQWMTVSWMSPMIAIGSRRQLNGEDVWTLSYEFQHTHLHQEFRRLTGGVVWRLVKANWIDLAILSILAILELLANYSAPLLLQQLLRAMQNTRYEKRTALIFAGLILTVRLIAAQSAVFSLWFGRRCYERSRGEMITMLYEKTLNRKIVGALDNEKENQHPPGSAAEDELVGEQDHNSEDPESAPLLPSKQIQHSHDAIGKIRSNLRAIFSFYRQQSDEPQQKIPTSMGKLLNLMKSDVYEVAQRFWEAQRLVNKPIGLLLSVVLVWKVVGWPCLVGIAVVVTAQVINAILAKVLISWEKVRRTATDARLQKTSQYIEAIRHLRWYSWHRTWLNVVMEAREKELNLKIVTFLISSIIIFVNMFANGFLPVTAFWAYTVLAGKELRIDVAFPALELFNLLQDNLRDIPNLITILLNSYVAVGRLEDFMNEPDKIDEAVHSTSDGILELKHASFAWPGAKGNVLEDLNLAFPIGLTVIYGPVAAGKTALLQALLGELDLREGELVRSDQPVGYCAQTTWLQSMSIRDNILFFSPFEEARYKATLDACELMADLAGFQHGDLSPIGENGIGLSGGQKARVALARAVFSSTTTLFLDDPLSALDQHTAETIVGKLIRSGLLKNRTVLLVTHRTDLTAGIADQIVELNRGKARVMPKDHFARQIPSSTGIERSSFMSQPKIATHDEGVAVPEKFEEEEYRAHGGVQAAVYWEYIKAGKLRWWLIVLLTSIMIRLLLLANSWLLKEWGEAYDGPKEKIFAFQFTRYAQLPIREASNTSNPLSEFFKTFPNPAQDVQPWLLAYFLIVVVYSVVDLFRSWTQLVIQYLAGRKLFGDILERVSRSSFRFYDITPVGRLMNRLTSDIGTIDGNIAWQFDNVTWQAVTWVVSIIVIASVTPLFVVASILLSGVFVYIFLRFLPTSQSLRRLEMVSLSPLMSNFGALVHGLITVRAFCAQTKFQDTVIAVTDTFQRMDHFYWSVQAWLMYRFDCLSAISTFLLTGLAIYSDLSSGLTAFVLKAADRFVVSTHSLCRTYGQLQLDFVSVERVIELLHIEQEDPGSIEPPAHWPSKDSDIVFEDITIKYAPDLAPALSEVSVTLKGGNNTAIIGRTGSGKSTLALSLLGTVPVTKGRITIGGLDISKVDKQALRSRITFLAQDPILFPGSLRHNLDPTDEHSDNACLSVISRVCPRYGWTLSTQIEAGGKNLSQGQRQLVGLARAILRRSSIVIMDEATASIDQQTAWEIQRVLREELRGSTVVTIAHRMSAVRDADACLELHNGKVVRMGRPQDVLGNVAGTAA